MPFRMVKQKIFPRPHSFQVNWGFALEDAIDTDTTMVPVCFYDEGLGATSAYESNPEHASFAETTSANCFPQSRVDNIYGNLSVRLSKAAIETDKVSALTFAVMVVSLAFKESYTAIDEKSQNEIQDILELQTESTDRQGGPLYVALDMPIGSQATAVAPTNTPFLDTNLSLEPVAFSEEFFYDAMQYYTNKGMLKKVQSGLKWYTLTKQRPYINIPIHIKSGSKFMNAYNYQGILVHAPFSGSAKQLMSAGDTTDVTHLYCSFTARYNEWNSDFNSARV